MKTVLHKAETRGHANHGWLNTYFSFSFAGYYNPERIHFGTLRVLNDDTIAAGTGFGMHPHDNMEIITIPTEGTLTHNDSMGNGSDIKEGDVQVMSAGSGVFHSESNKDQHQQVKLFQIWVFPNKKNVTPRYDQISLKNIEKENELYQILSPSLKDQGVWIHQDAWFSMGKLKAGSAHTYYLKKEGNGLYVFMIEGSAEIAGQVLNKRDGFGIWETETVPIDVKKDSWILLMDIPMQL
ncbi:MAG: pirin family protein [Bacteroidales bacterium]|nr:pirin family protein [Bacteroidales bacterium]